MYLVQVLVPVGRARVRVQSAVKVPVLHQVHRVRLVVVRAVKAVKAITVLHHRIAVPQKAVLFHQVRSPQLAVA